MPPPTPPRELDWRVFVNPVTFPGAIVAAVIATLIVRAIVKASGAKL